MSVVPGRLESERIAATAESVDARLSEVLEAEPKQDPGTVKAVVSCEGEVTTTDSGESLSDPPTERVSSPIPTAGHNGHDGGTNGDALDGGSEECTAADTTGDGVKGLTESSWHADQGCPEHTNGFTEVSKSNGSSAKDGPAPVTETALTEASPGGKVDEEREVGSNDAPPASAPPTEGCGSDGDSLSSSVKTQVENSAEKECSVNGEPSKKGTPADQDTRSGVLTNGRGSEGPASTSGDQVAGEAAHAGDGSASSKEPTATNGAGGLYLANAVATSSDVEVAAAPQGSDDLAPATSAPSEAAPEAADLHDGVIVTSSAETPAASTDSSNRVAGTPLDKAASSAEASIQDTVGAEETVEEVQPVDPPTGADEPAASAEMAAHEPRSIWVVGSEEDLTDLGAESAGDRPAPSWGTVSSTVRAIRVFKRGVSKRLRRPHSSDTAPAPPVDRQVSHQSFRSHGAVTATADLTFRAAEEPTPEEPPPAPPAAAAPAAEDQRPHGLFRAFSFRRTGSLRQLRRDRPLTGSLRRPRDHPTKPAAAASETALYAGMLEGGGGGGAAPVRPHVATAAFLADAAAYRPPADARISAKDKAAVSGAASVAPSKEELRTGSWPLELASRATLWQNICQLHGAPMGAAEEYQSTVRQLEGEYGAAGEHQHQLPPFVHSFYTNHYHLRPAGVSAAVRVLAVLYYNNPTITYSPPLYPVCCLLLHYMDESDTYNALSMMLRNKKLGFLVQTRRDFEITWKTLIKLCRKHTKSSLHYLHQQARDEENVEHVLADWVAWVFCFLPFTHAVRLMDCYLMEGEKVLYRAAMALLLLLHKMASRELGDWGARLQQQSVQDVMEQFCRDIPVTPDKLLRTLFNIRGFSRESVTAAYARVKSQIKAGGGRLNFPERRAAPSVTKQPSHPGMGMPSVMSQDELARSSSTIGVKEHSAKYPQLKDPELALINFEELLRLWENLPQRYALYTPLLLYTSDEHGFSLKTFYQKVATYEPTVLLLRTTEGAVFGAYCSTSWGARNQVDEDGSRHTYFGTGETFLFQLRPQLCVYPWVGRTRQAADPELSGVSHAEQLFMAANYNMITIGGGGGQAIWLDENLSTGRTDACKTFDNPPLTQSGSFQVACMEAFGFSPA